MAVREAVGHAGVAQASAVPVAMILVALLPGTVASSAQLLAALEARLVAEHLGAAASALVVGVAGETVVEALVAAAKVVAGLAPGWPAGETARHAAPTGQRLVQPEV